MSIRLLELPVEVQSKILLKLPIETLRPLRVVSQHFEELISLHPDYKLIRFGILYVAKTIRKALNSCRSRGISSTELASIFDAGYKLHADSLVVDYPAPEARLNELINLGNQGLITTNKLTVYKTRNAIGTLEYELPRALKAKFFMLRLPGGPTPGIRYLKAAPESKWGRKCELQFVDSTERIISRTKAVDPNAAEIAAKNWTRLEEEYLGHIANFCFSKQDFMAAVRTPWAPLHTYTLQHVWMYGLFQIIIEELRSHLRLKPQPPNFDGREGQGPGYRKVKPSIMREFRELRHLYVEDQNKLFWPEEIGRAVYVLDARLPQVRQLIELAIALHPVRESIDKDFRPTWDLEEKIRKALKESANESLAGGFHHDYQFEEYDYEGSGWVGGGA
ncbi:unnamed protein product, partial [Mesorhabditis spiculigera]